MVCAQPDEEDPPAAKARAHGATLSPPGQTPPRWEAIDAARRRSVTRVPFAIDHVHVGSVALAALPALKAAAAQHQPELTIQPNGVRLRSAPDRREPLLRALNEALRAQGWIRAWRDEPIALPDPATQEPLAVMERAAARFWGSQTTASHLNGYVADAQGRPTHLWIAQRAANKATDPGKLDNLTAGGVPLGQSPQEALVREAWEEAGLRSEQVEGLTAGRVMLIDADVPEGRMVERLHVFDLAVPPGFVPVNQDGEVQAWHRVPVAQAARWAAEGRMTTDAALATLDFLLRRRLLAADAHRALHWQTRHLWASFG
jgi:8-oxo-dGTP pyrophosphatase MutT (NUDIX family)